MHLVETGHYALIVAVSTALAQCIAGALKRYVVNGSFMVLSWAQLFFVLWSFGVLMYAHIVSDFSVLNVWQHSHTAEPILYKISGTWGSHEGSMLLWVVWLSVFNAFLGLNIQCLPDRYYRLSMGILGFVGVGCIAFVLLSSNPFERVWPIPVNGMDLNPLLQDPGLAFHPPLLYGGYVGFSVTFALTWSSLYHPAIPWAQYIRPWALLAWGLLTLGIASGSWWAYYELGWGGWWFWDPVENASLLPWLAGLALIHSLRAQQTTRSFKLWSLALGLAAFSYSILGAFLVRSGILSSVHTFAVDPARGVFFLVFLCLICIPSVILFAWRAFYIGEGTRVVCMSRELSIGVQNIFVTIGLFVILYGTLYPLIAQSFFEKHVTVGDAYYRVLLLPLLIPFSFSMGIGPLLQWRQNNTGIVWKLILGFLLMLTCLYGILLVARNIRMPLMSLCVLSAGIWVMSLTVCFAVRCTYFNIHRMTLYSYPRGRLCPLDFTFLLNVIRGFPWCSIGMILSHFGVGIFLCSMAMNTAWREEYLYTMEVGETIHVATYRLTFQSMQRVPGSNYIANRAVFYVADHQGSAMNIHLMPERRFYYAHKTVVTESSIYSNGLCNLYITIGDTQDNVHWPVRIHIDPMAPGLWFGSALVGLGSIVLGLQQLKRRRRHDED